VSPSFSHHGQLNYLQYSHTRKASRRLPFLVSTALHESSQGLCHRTLCLRHPVHCRGELQVNGCGSLLEAFL